MKALLENFRTQLPKYTQIFTDMNAAGLHGLDLCLGRTAAAADNGTGMSHTPARRRGQAGNFFNIHSSGKLYPAPFA